MRNKYFNGIKQQFKIRPQSLLTKDLLKSNIIPLYLNYLL